MMALIVSMTDREAEVPQFKYISQKCLGSR